MQRCATRPVLLSALLTLSFVLIAGCGKSSKKKDNRPPPAKPSNGSPIAATFVKFEPDDGRTNIHMSLYNFGDKTSGGYVFLARYYDKAGKLLKSKPGTRFEKDYDFTSLSGGLSNQCEPKNHCSLTVSFGGVPKGAVRAELLVSKVQAVDGMKLVDWWRQKFAMTWPKDAKKSGAPAKPAK